MGNRGRGWAKKRGRFSVFLPNVFSVPKCIFEERSRVKECRTFGKKQKKVKKVEGRRGKWQGLPLSTIIPQREASSEMAMKGEPVGTKHLGRAQRTPRWQIRGRGNLSQKGSVMVCGYFISTAR